MKYTKNLIRENQTRLTTLSITSNQRKTRMKSLKYWTHHIEIIKPNKIKNRQSIEMLVIRAELVKNQEEMQSHYQRKTRMKRFWSFIYIYRIKIKRRMLQKLNCHLIKFYNSHLYILFTKINSPQIPTSYQEYQTILYSLMTHLVMQHAIISS